MALLGKNKTSNRKTPHAAVIVWNYDDRGSDEGFDDTDAISQTIISTVSCVSITTNKTKANPAGTFQFVLAPTKNWVAEISSGSWCAILMSTEPITKSDFKLASKSKLKMIGKIETVRVDVNADSNGTRQTYYTVSGTDWGHIFNNILYIDNYVYSPKAPSLGDGAAIALQEMLSKGIDNAKDFETLSNIKAIAGLFGQPLPGLSNALSKEGLIVNAIYTFSVPRQMMTYLGMPPITNTFNQLLTIKGGVLLPPKAGTYSNKSESYGFINPFALQGQHSFWQVLLEHSNPTLNELVAEISWDGFGIASKPTFALYCRIRPFSLPSFGLFDPRMIPYRSLFNLLPRTLIDTVDVKSLNAGTNWRDKYNFIEIKVDVPNYEIIGTEVKANAQEFDEDAFEREGFRPLISTTKQFPKPILPFGRKIDFSLISVWKNLLREWYFDTHRMLNGTITFVGQPEYIGVGENIQFSGSLLTASNNTRSSKTALLGLTEDVLAHVESVSHSFTVNQEDGARSFTTTIQFVRGVMVNPQTGVPDVLTSGKLDEHDSDMGVDVVKNKNVYKTSTSDDPDR